MPTRVFWTMYHQIRFLQAEENLQKMSVLRISQAGAPESMVKDFIRDQEFEIEQVMIPDRDEEARQGRNQLRKLAAMFGGGKQ